MAGGIRDDDVTRLALAGARGDAEATIRFVQATQRDVQRFLSGLVGSREAEDLAQETYLRALRSLPRFAGRSSARTWLLSIARRTAADHIRSIVRRPRAGSFPGWELVAENTEPVPAVEERVLLRELVLALHADRREAFVLTQMLDLSYGEAATVCGCPVGTIRSRVARARADLVAALDNGASASGSAVFDEDDDQLDAAGQ
ncbi:sigma-70 family RNA polymerase sigma factor [Pseudonocardia spinosispora]|uniref:sigma-70 family RNA polymerase sigma factor n=1 Tax=Pseudonocardia spinosispora TaxID=103441 RepID=UPI00040FFA19|nr:sigma-70 family RNA polymerase sigma factor [Pseudonocardia spinosispora]